MIRVVFLGAGGWISKPDLGPPSVVIEGPQGDALLIDAGEGVYAALARCGIGINKLSSVFISHLHGDHVLGLATLLTTRLYGTRLWSAHERAGPLKVILLRDLVEDLKSVLKVVGAPLEGAEFVGVNEGECVELGGVTLTFIKALHTVPALSLKVDVRGRCIVYSGDTAYNERLVEVARNCDVLIHEASGYIEEARKYGHSTVYDALRVAASANVRIVVLTHYYLEPPPLRLEALDFARGLNTDVMYAYPCAELRL